MQPLKIPQTDAPVDSEVVSLLPKVEDLHVHAKILDQTEIVISDSLMSQYFIKRPKQH